MEVDLVSTSKEYFSSMNTLAKKISTDIENTREAYQGYWHSLSAQEQNQVIDESIITPSALIRYAHLNMLMTENPNVHSWFTKSQLNLNEHYADKQEKSTNKSVDRSILRKKLSETRNHDPEQDYRNKDTVEEKRFSNSSKLQSVGHKSSVLKPKNPPPPPPSKSVLATAETDTEDSLSGESEIPKTGFDFLDNW